MAKILTNYGQRVLKSVFECNLNDRLFLKLKRDLEFHLDREVDSIRYYILCKTCKGNIEISGLGSVRDDEEVIIV